MAARSVVPTERLTRPRVVGAAVALVDAEGPEALTMRRLAADLGVGTMSLYHHVTDRAELVEAVAAEVLGALVQARPDPDWTVPVRTMAHAYRASVLAHPGVFRLLLSTPVTATAAARLDAVDVVVRSGEDPARAAASVRAVARFLLGWCLVETSRSRRHRAEEDGEFAAAVDALLAGLASA